MKSSLRTTVAAALVMLAPVASVLVTTPAGAQVPTPAVRGMGSHAGGSVVLIDRFEMFGTPAVGSALRFRIQGANSGFASVVVPGHPGVIEMKEVSPGIYEGSIVVSSRYDPRLFYGAVAELQAASTRVTARLGGSASAPVGQEAHDRQVAREEGRLWGDSRWANPRSRDQRAPEIRDLTPSNGDRINDRNRTRVSARFADDNSGVDARDVSLRIDGRDVTGSSRIEGDEIQFRGDLAAGRHVAEVIVRDRAGNVARRSWSFDVVDRYGRGNAYDNSYGYGYGQRW